MFTDFLFAKVVKIKFNMIYFDKIGKFLMVSNFFQINKTFLLLIFFYKNITIQKKITHKAINKNVHKYQSDYKTSILNNKIRKHSLV